MKRPSPEEVHDWVLKLHAQCQQELTPQEVKEQRKYATMVQKPNDKAFLSKMLDESSQIRDRKKLAKRIKVLVDRYGIPEFFNARDNFLFKIYQTIGYHFDAIAIPVIKKRLRLDTSGVIIDEARPHLTKHLLRRSKQKIGQNVNLLGEVVLGNLEADKRFHHYLEALESPDINYISVKISGIYAQTHALNFHHSFPDLVERMSMLYQKAIDFPYVDAKGEKHPKFINLDMEEYKDTHLTLRLFKTVLSKPEFKNYCAGIVIQAYLPDAWDFQSELLEFAKQRVAAGGAPIKMRLVKGCNLEMETVISSLRGWNNPVRKSKTEVDANYLHILDRALLPENASVVRVGVASHNLFTISYAYLLSQRYGTSAHMTFEMLEGMANHLWRAQSSLGNHVILYTPVVRNEHFLNAVSYLVRRLDENTGPENFLSYSFNLEPETETWNFLQQQFDEAYALKDHLSHISPRKQDRTKPYAHRELSDKMENEPDTDFDLKPNQLWAEMIVDKWKKHAGNKAEIIPLQIGKEVVVSDKRHVYKDRCQNDAVNIYEMSQANLPQIRQIIKIAGEDPAGWRRTTLEERHKILHLAGNYLAEMRGDLIGCMCAVTGKSIVEGDVEVSEAVDYARFYTIAMKEFERLEGIEIKPKGAVLVISPWNFPCAIPVGGISAALAGGNTVILKPATVAAPVAWMFAEAFWKAGVPKEALQVIITDREALKELTSDPTIRHIILTGGTETAQQIQQANPMTPLAAETGGKNAVIITASADRDHAILNTVASAFGNAGQKCSACSLLLVEQSVFDDPSFREKLTDAATSLKTGSIWDMGNIVGPMITNKNDKLLKAISELQAGESWLVPPKFLDEKQYILAPSIKWNVKPENFAFQTELFGPMLSVAPIKDLDEGIRLVNNLDYGLTSGIQSLDESEQEKWRENIIAGNLYINRGITGAIVNRQPFGGMKLSAFGGGVKAGGPNYCLCFVDIRDKHSSENYQESYQKAWQEEFSVIRDVNNLYGEQNLFRYLPVESIGFRVLEKDSLSQVVRVCHAAEVCGVKPTLSIAPGDPKLAALGKLKADIRIESTDEFIQSIKNYERLRCCSSEIPEALYRAAAENNKYIATAPPVSEGRIELLHYLKEQSVSFEYHRYGSITEIPAVS